jgi:release factor glutamine methyltransferase
MTKIILADFLKHIKNTFKQNNILSYSIDAEIIICHILSISREKLISTSNTIIVSNEEYENTIQLVNRRLDGEPIAYITGKKDFWDFVLRVTSDTLIPRPDTEILVESVIRQIKNNKFFQHNTAQILDIGTGSGCILIALMREIRKIYSNASGIGIDISAEAIEVAKHNAYKSGLDENAIMFMNKSWEDFANSTNMKFNVIVSNPPYIPSQDILNLMSDVRNYEPYIALDGGDDGLVCYRDIMHLIPKLSQQNTLVAFECGVGQNTDIIEIMHKNAIQVIETVKDISGIPRVIVGLI